MRDEEVLIMVSRSLGFIEGRSQLDGGWWEQRSREVGQIFYFRDGNVFLF